MFSRMKCTKDPRLRIFNCAISENMCVFERVALFLEPSKDNSVTLCLLPRWACHCLWTLGPRSAGGQAPDNGVCKVKPLVVIVMID